MDNTKVQILCTDAGTYFYRNLRLFSGFLESICFVFFLGTTGNRSIDEETGTGNRS